jgi:ABC-type uncharacterized transport system permease subunit
MIVTGRPAIDEVQVQHALALADGRTPVLITVSGWGVARVGKRWRWYWGPTCWRALVPVPSTLQIRLRNLWGSAKSSTPLLGNAPATPRIRVPATPQLGVRVRRDRLRAGLSMPAVPRFRFSLDRKEPSNE